ncbi:MAG: glycosyltransferase family 39 protein [Chloroflexota bacterium]|nr:glycosyltransferase family 39 protein [Chloroflexota bacterium]
MLDLAPSKGHLFQAFPRWWRMLPLLLLVTLLAAQGINADVIWYDELTSIGHAGGLTGPFSPLDVLDSIRTHSPKHGPLFFELLAAWGALVGWHHAVLRCLPLFFGILTLAWVYRIGVDFLGWRAGLYASAFLGLNVFWLEYFHEIRMYTAQAAMLVAMLWHYLHIAQSKSTIGRARWLGLILFASLSLYAQPFSFFVFLAVGFYHLAFVPKTKRWIHTAAAFLLVGVLYLPWLPVTYVGLTTKFDAWGEMPFEQAVEVFLQLLSNGNWLVILIAFVAAAARLRKRENLKKALPFWVLAFVVLALLLSVNEAVRLIPLRRSRYFFVVFYPMALIIGSGLAWIRPRALPLIILGLYLGSGFMLRGREDYVWYQGTIRAIQSYPPIYDYVLSLRDLVSEEDFIVGFSDINFIIRRGKVGKSTADYYFETLMGIDGAFIRTHLDDAELEVDIPDKLEDHPYLLFTYNPLNKPAIFDRTRSIIERDYAPCELVLDEAELRVERYVYRTLDCDRKYQPIRYDNGISIVDKFADFIPDRDVLRVVTGWEVADKALLYQYNISIQIHSLDGQKVAQINPDRHLYHDVLKWFVVELSTSDLPPGDYNAVVLLYDRYPPHAKVFGADIESGEHGKVLPIGSFNIPG